jgi:hypothetical protein
MASNLTQGQLPQAPMLQGQNTTAPAELSALRPVIEPPPIPWWPPAPGWWMLLASIILLFGVLVFVFYKRRKKFIATRYLREAEGLLANVLTTTNAPAQQLQSIAHIMRRAAISAYGREHVGTLPWTAVAALNTAPILDDKSLALLGNALYRQQPPQADEIMHLLGQARLWLHALPSHQVNKP